MKIFIRILKASAISLAIGLFLIFLAGAVLLKWPQLVLNTSFLSSALPWMERLGIRLHYEDAMIQIQSKSWFDKEFDLQFKNLCFLILKDGSEGCIEHFKLAGEIAARDWRIELISLGPVQIQNATLRLSAPLNKSRTSFSLNPNLPKLILPSLLQKTHFKPLEIEIREMKYPLSPTRFLTATLQAEAILNEMKKLEGIEIKAQLIDPASMNKGNLNARLSSPSYFLKNDWHLKIDLNGVFSQNKECAGFFHLEPKEENELDYDTHLNCRRSAENLDLHLNGRFLKGRLENSFSGKLDEFVAFLPPVHLENCTLDLIQEDLSSSKMELRVNCPVSTRLSDLKLPGPAFKRLIQTPLPVALLIRLNSQVSFFQKTEQPVQGTLEIKMDPVDQKLLKASGKTITLFSGISSSYPEGWKVQTQGDLSLRLKSFSEWVRALDQTAFAIPAPLRILEGEMEFKMNGDIHFMQNQASFPLEFATHLSSEKQRLETQGKGQFNLNWGKNKTQKLTMELMLSDLKIVLPPVGIENRLPSLTLDPRIKKPGMNKHPETSSSFTYDLKIKTPPEHPALLISNLVPEGIPVGMDLHLKPEGVFGNLNLQKSQMEVFRRKAQIIHFDLNLSDPVENSTVDGELQVRYADYTIHLMLQGPVNKPVLLMESDPYLSREDILSVLIYGKTFIDLNSEESDTVSNTSAAVMDRALTLGSLFLLSGSPIQSVSYNPQTKNLSAKIRLASGTSLDIGTRLGQGEQIGLQRRLNGNWRIRSYFENVQNTGQKKGGALLEWEKRY